MQIGEEVMTKKIIVLSQLLVTWESIFLAIIVYIYSVKYFHLSDFIRQIEFELKYLLSGFYIDMIFFLMCGREDTWLKALQSRDAFPSHL